MDASSSVASSLTHSAIVPAASSPNVPHLLPVTSTPPLSPRGTMTSPALSPRSLAVSSTSVAAAVAQTSSAGWQTTAPVAAPAPPPGAHRIDLGPGAARIDLGPITLGSPTVTHRSISAPTTVAMTAPMFTRLTTPPPTPPVPQAPTVLVSSVATAPAPSTVVAARQSLQPQSVLIFPGGSNAACPVRMVNSPARTPTAGPVDVPPLQLHQLSLQSSTPTSPRSVARQVQGACGGAVVIVAPAFMEAGGSSITVSAAPAGSSLTVSAAQPAIMGSPSAPLPMATAVTTVHAAPAPHLSVRSRASSAGANRQAAFPGLMVTSGRSTANSSGSSIPGTHGSQRPRSAQSRIGAYTYLTGASSGQRLTTARGRAPVTTTAAVASQQPLHWSPRSGRAEKVHTLGSPRPGSPRGGSAIASHRVASPTTLLSSPGMSPPRRTSMSPRPGVREVVPGLAATWAEVLELVNRSRLPVGASGASSTVGSSDGANGRPKEQVQPPDPWRTRRACQALAGVVNRMPDDLLRRVLAVLVEELFNSIFRDYSFAYDPREELGMIGGMPLVIPGLPDGGAMRPASPGRLATPPLPAPRPPRLSEECLTNAVPYSAVVQSLRDAAKDAIMRRLELEAKCSAGGVEGGTAASVDGGSEANARSSADGLRAGEEVQLREELRHAKLLAETYQARTLELERARIELEEEVRRARQERDRDDARKQKLNDEVRRLRLDGNSARPARAYKEGRSMQEEDAHSPTQEQKMTTPRVPIKAHTPQLGGSRDGGAGRPAAAGRNAAGGASGNAGLTSSSSSRRVAENRRATAPAGAPGISSRVYAPPGASQLDTSTSNIEDVTNSLPPPSEEELPGVSRLRRNRTAGEVGVSVEEKKLSAQRSFRTPRERSEQRALSTGERSARAATGMSHTSSGTSLLGSEQTPGKCSGPADAAAGGSSSRLRKSSGPMVSSATSLGNGAGTPQSARGSVGGPLGGSNTAARQANPTRVVGVGDWFTKQGWR